MRTEEQKKAYYEQLAYDYAGQAVLGRYRASVHLENKDDEWFWNNMLQKYRPGKYNFIYYSRNHKGADTAGCTQCMAFRDYLSDKLAKNFKKDVLMGNLAFDRYDEIQRVTKDIQAL